MIPGPTDRSAPLAGKGIKPLTEFSEQAINEWIGRLPLSDVDAACEAIYGLLRAVNVTDGLECLDRHRIVEQVRPPAVSLLAMSSERHLPPQALFPLPPGVQALTQRGVDISLELASAYRRVVTSGTFFSEQVMTEAGRAQVVYRALQAYGHALLRSLERYESPPPGFWREVYGFYRFAEGHKLHNAHLPMPEIEGATIESQFKQMLLLSLSSHQHHTPDEIRQFYTVLMLIAKDAVIGAVPEWGNEVAMFYFDIHTDNAPRPVKRAKKQSRGERRYVFVRGMLTNAREYFSTPSHRASERFKLRNEIIIRLLETLSAAEKRRYMRVPADGSRQFVIGLPQLIDKLSGTGQQVLSESSDSELTVFGMPPPVPPSAAQPMDEDEPDDVEIVLGQGSADMERTEIWTKNIDSVVFSKPVPARPFGTAESAAPAEAANVELSGNLLNMSAGGYCISWLNPLFAGARVGELIGIYEEKRRIHVGVMRWLHHKSKTELVFGVELLSPRVEAVELAAGLGRSRPESGLYFSANQKLGQPASLMCGPGAYKVGREVAFITKGQWRRFRLASLLNATLSFQLFSLAELPDAGPFGGGPGFSGGDDEAVPENLFGI